MVLSKKPEEPLTFHQLVTCLHRLVPFNPTLAHSLVPRLRQGMGSGSWAKLLQIYDQDGRQWRVLGLIPLQNWRFSASTAILRLGLDI